MLKRPNPTYLFKKFVTDLASQGMRVGRDGGSVTMSNTDCRLNISKVAHGVSLTLECNGKTYTFKSSAIKYVSAEPYAVLVVFVCNNTCYTFRASKVLGFGVV